MCWVDREEEVELARKLAPGETEAFDRFVEHFRPNFQYSWLIAAIGRTPRKSHRKRCSRS